MKVNKISFEKFSKFVSNKGHKLCIVYSENKKVKFLGCKSKTGHNYVISVPEKYTLTVDKKDGISSLELKSTDIDLSPRQLEYATDVGCDVFVQNSSTIVTVLSKRLTCYIRVSDCLITGSKVDILEKELESRLKVSKKVETVQENRIKQIEEELDKINKVDIGEDLPISESLAEDVNVKNIEKSDIVVGCILPLFDLNIVLKEDDLEKIVSEISDKISLFTEECLRNKVEKVKRLLKKIVTDFDAKAEEYYQSMQNLIEHKSKLSIMYQEIDNQKNGDTSDLKEKIIDTTNAVSLELFTKRNKFDLTLTDYDITLQELISMLK